MCGCTRLREKRSGLSFRENALLDQQLYQPDRCGIIYRAFRACNAWYSYRYCHGRTETNTEQYIPQPKRLFRGRLLLPIAAHRDSISNSDLKESAVACQHRPVETPALRARFEADAYLPSLQIALR